MKRKKQYEKYLRNLTEKQLESLFDRQEYNDLRDYIMNYWIDLYWRNRNRLGLYTLNEVCNAGVYESLPVRSVKV